MIGDFSWEELTDDDAKSIGELLNVGFTNRYKATHENKNISIFIGQLSINYMRISTLFHR